MDLDTNNDITVEEARKILGKTAEGLSDEQLQEEMAKISFLAESWFDEYEKSIFDGRTLNECVQS